MTARLPPSTELEQTYTTVSLSSNTFKSQMKQQMQMEKVAGREVTHHHK
jgi:hypothetical protein